MALHSNKWNWNGLQLENISIPQRYLSQPGIFYHTINVDESVGPEIALFIYDPTEFIYDIENVNPFRFNIKSLAIRTSYGPICTLLFFIDDPIIPNYPFVLYDKPVDLTNNQMLEPYYALGNQEYVHLILLDVNLDIIRLIEFENTFELSESFDFLRSINLNPQIDFGKACEEYYSRYTLRDLYLM